MPADAGRPVTPLLLLDVDGVLNAVTRRPDRSVWPDWHYGQAEANGTLWPIHFSPAVTSRVRGWHQQGLAELQWLTTWGHAANGGLRALLDLPELEVAGTPDEAGAASELTAASLAGSTAAAPDELTGRWWKLDVVRRLRSEQPGRRTLWVDDELRGAGNPFLAWARRSEVATFGPEPTSGLTEADLTAIEKVLHDG